MAKEYRTALFYNSVECAHFFFLNQANIHKGRGIYSLSPYQSARHMVDVL